MRSILKALLIMIVRRDRFSLNSHDRKELKMKLSPCYFLRIFLLLSFGLFFVEVFIQKNIKNNRALQSSFLFQSYSFVKRPKN